MDKEPENKMSPQEEKLYKIRHSLAHVLAQAVLELRPGAKLAFGPPIENGFYYDFDLEQPLTPEDLPEIEKRMRKIIKAKQAFEHFTRSIDQTLSYLREHGEIYKIEHVEELAARGENNISFYRSGNFEDMCRGPHVTHTGELPEDSFSIDSIAGAYWRGDEKRPMLTRLYALCFSNKEELVAFKEARRLAKERDHRKLGSELELFTIIDKVGPGLPLWLPNGTILRDELEKLAKEMEFLYGYQRVSTPHLAKENLYITSGHLPYYKDTMFPPMLLEGEEPYYLRAMNCPHHFMIYKSRPRSYRELPLRLAEYGTVYRYEDSGALSGLLRVRMLSMNDAHMFCRPDQLRQEFISVLKLHEFYYNKFRIEKYSLRLSLHDPARKDKYIDEPEGWSYAEGLLREVLTELNIPFEEALGEAAFYGPKIDVQLRNVIGREETVSTIQLDFAAPKRFDLSYIAEDGKEHRPYVIHRAPLSTHERMLAYLIEHFGGAFPTWMAPLQVRILPVADKFLPYAKRLEETLFQNLIRVDIDASAESFNKRLRNAITHKIPNMLIVGNKEESDESVTWRRYAIQEQQTLKFTEFTTLLKSSISQRTMDNFPPPAGPASNAA